MDGNGETPIFRVKIWNHQIETTILKWMFRVPGMAILYTYYMYID